MRAFGIPLFLWVVLVHGSPLWGVLILVVGGATDYLDGKLARALHQESRLGELLDPAVDRLYIIAIIFALYSENVLPGWVVALLFGRDLWYHLLDGAWVPMPQGTIGPWATSDSFGVT